MVSPVFSAVLLLLCAVPLPLAHGQADGSCSSVAQPLATRVDPPSGTTGQDEGASTRYTVTGSLLDQVDSIMVRYDGSTTAGTVILTRNGTAIEFYIDARLTAPFSATLSVVPTDPDCMTATFDIMLFGQLVVNFGSRSQAHPGSVLFVTFSSCVPNSCGDNSTTFDIVVGDITLEQLSTQNTSLKYAGRFPNFATSAMDLRVAVRTQYQIFLLSEFFTFDLDPLRILSVTPNTGQLGTSAIVAVDEDFGPSSSVTISQVRLGEVGAQIVDGSDHTMIRVRSGSGNPGLVDVRVNTTVTFDDVAYDGPYTYLEDGWTQLEDGSITDIIPPAAQLGRSVLLCGNRLLGGGTSVVTIERGPDSFTLLQSTPLPSVLPLPGTECLQVQIPNALQGINESNVIITSDTGAMVPSAMVFSLSAIESVSPARGQEGTVVTIRGRALLSGYPGASPIVFLSDVVAIVLRSNDTEIVVRAGSIPTFLPGATAPQIIGIMGSIVIEVPNPISTSSTFNVSISTGWQYEELGVIDRVDPNFGQLGTLITITGSNLLAYGVGLTHATIGGTNATILDGATNSMVQLEVPDSETTGIVDVILFSDTGANVRGSNTFQYMEKGVIQSALPSQGQNGTFVRILGTNLFGHGSSITSVLFGNVTATVNHSTSNDTAVEVRVQANDNTINEAVSIRITADTGAIISSSTPWTFLVQGQISSNEPQQGQAGTMIEIIGTNLLGGGRTISEIFLDGVSGTVLSNSLTRIEIVMGDLLTRQASFFPGQVYIMSDSGAVVFGGAYMHRESGVITSLSPNRGRRGTVVTLRGTNMLGFGTSLSGVEIAGIRGDIVSFNNTVVVVRAGLGPANQAGPVVLRVDTGAVIMSSVDFTFDEPGIVSSVTPTQGAEGTGVLVSGSGLIPSSVQLVNVTVGGVLVSRVVTASNQEVSIIVGPAPSSNPESAMIVINANDGSFVDGISFRFITLSLTLPGLSRGQEGTEVEVSLPNSPQFETNLNLRATVDNQPAVITNKNTMQRRITISIPRARRHGSFTADVAVEGMNGLIARLRDGFTYLPEGVICVIEPATGQTGTNIMLQGENLLGGGSVITSASVVGQPATILQSGDGTVALQLNQGTLGDGSVSYPLLGDIVLTADTGAIVRRLDVFSLAMPGSISQISPQVGQNGTRVDITGTDLLQGSLTIDSVTLAGVTATVLGVPTAAVISVEAASSGATQPLPVVITLSTGATISSSGSGLTFQYLTAGQVSTVDPNTGTTGTRVRISGTNLLQGGVSANAVTLGGILARIDSVSDTVIDVTAQAGVSGMGDVVIVSDTGSTVTRSRLWTYIVLGSISSVAPNTGQQGFSVTISGVSLLGPSASRFTACILAGVNGSIVGQISNTTLQCRAGASPPNRIDIPGPVQVITNTGVTLTSAQDVTFTYYAASIGSISPTRGNNGTEVTIRGMNLFTNPENAFQLSRVLFGTVEATVISSSVNEISVRVGFSSLVSTSNTVRIESSSGSFLELTNAWTYTIPGQILSVSPPNGVPGDTITLLGENLVSDGVAVGRVILGQTEAFDVQFTNASAIQFRAGVYENSDVPGEGLPVQIVSATGETTFSTNIEFTYNETGGTVSSISPQAGSENSLVVIEGTSLPNASDIMRITLADVPAAMILSVTEDEIIVEAGIPPPSGARGQVVIETSDGRLLGLAGDVWEYFPVITSSDVSPLTGQNGTTVTIDLSQIADLPAIVGVSLTTSAASNIEVSNGTLAVQAGPSTNTPLGDVTIEFADDVIVTIFNAWSYQSPVTVSEVTPSSGYFNTLVRIDGSGFQANSVAITAVYLAGMETTIESQTDTVLSVRITQEVLSRNSTVGPVTILADSGAFYSSDGVLNFTYVGVQLDSISPESGTRGTVVTLTGVGLLAGGAAITPSSATIAGVPATVQSMTSTMVSLIAGALDRGSNLSSITYSANTEARITFPDSWSYIEPGEITSVTPSTGAMGTIVSISGNNLFGGGTRAVAVVLGSQVTTNILESFDNFVQVVAAAGVSSIPGSVQIISDTQSVTESPSSVQFTYLTPGAFTSINPSSGQNGTVVTITGERFHNGEGIVRVFVAGVEAEIRNVQDSSTATTTITVEVRRSVSSGTFEGPVVVQSSSNGTTVSAQNFVYRTEGVIFSVVPSSGRNGTIVSIEGENMLGGGTGLMRVILAGEEATVVNGTSSTIFVIAPLGSGNSNTLIGDVLLVSDTNAHVRRVDGWTYVPQGMVDSVSPTQGQHGTRITISGQNLLSGGQGISTLRFGDVPVDILSASDTSLTARIGSPMGSVSGPAMTTGSIQLTSDLGGVLYLEYTWNFLIQSTITSVDPPSGFGQQMVTVSGTNLFGGGTEISSVTAAGITGTVLMGNSNNQVQFITGSNDRGEAITGDLILESDTGALTIDRWSYDEECPNNTYGTVGNCLPCDDQCAGCFGPSELNCTMCKNFGIVFGENSSNLRCVTECPSLSTLDNVCVDACELNQFEQVDTLQNKSFCFNCSNLCDPNLGCSGPEPSQCNGCMFFRDVTNQTCIESCPSSNFFNQTKECIPCDPECSGGCIGPTDADCFGCTNLQINAITITDAITPLHNIVCRSSCPSLYFLDSSRGYCVPCDSACSIACSGPTPFDCTECKDVAFMYPNGTRLCMTSCNDTSPYYQDTNGECQPCSSLCLPSEGCSGPNPSECNSCSLSQDSKCVGECTDSTYFIRTTTRTCERCHESCGNSGCNENGPGNCLRQGSLSAGPGTIAFVIVVVLILLVIIAVLVFILIWRYRCGRFTKYKMPNNLPTFLKRTKQEESVTFTKQSKVQDIPLASIEEKKTSSNPMFVEEGGFYSEMGPEGVEVLVENPAASSGIECLYSETDAGEEDDQLQVLEKNTALSASQNVYTDMDNLPPSLTQIEDVSPSQDVYTDMEPILPDREPKAAPSLPPKPVETTKREGEKPQVPLPPLPAKGQSAPPGTGEKPPIPVKAEKPIPPGPPVDTEPPSSPGPELYTDMQGGITEVFINAGVDDVYVDVESDPVPSSSPLSSSTLIDDTLYEDTESALAAVEEFRKSFGAGTKTSYMPGEPIRKSIGGKPAGRHITTQKSAPALPSQPIPKKRSQSSTPLPQTPLQKSLSSTSTVSGPISPTSSSFSRPQSVISAGSGIPEEESLYDDVGAIQPLVSPPPAKPPPAKLSKSQQKKLAKQKKTKK